MQVQHEKYNTKLIDNKHWTKYIDHLVYLRWFSVIATYKHIFFLFNCSIRPNIDKSDPYLTIYIIKITKIYYSILLRYLRIVGPCPLVLTCPLMSAKLTEIILVHYFQHNINKYRNWMPLQEKWILRDETMNDYWW